MFLFTYLEIIVVNYNSFREKTKVELSFFCTHYTEYIVVVLLAFSMLNAYGWSVGGDFLLGPELF